jgi:hypothetical protein
MPPFRKKSSPQRVHMPFEGPRHLISNLLRSREFISNKLPKEDPDIWWHPCAPCFPEVCHCRPLWQANVHRVSRIALGPSNQQGTTSTSSMVCVTWISLMRLSHSTATTRLKDLRKCIRYTSASRATLTMMKGDVQQSKSRGNRSRSRDEHVHQSIQK